jgi:hypothetical protein
MLERVAEYLPPAIVWLFEGYLRREGGGSGGRIFSLSDTATFRVEMSSCGVMGRGMLSVEDVEGVFTSSGC